MHKFLKFVEDSSALLILVGIVSVSVLTTLSLSPVAVESGSQVAAASTDKQENTKLRPLVITSLHKSEEGPAPEVVSLGERSYEYIQDIPPSPAGVSARDFISIVNPNERDITIRFTAKVPRSLGVVMLLTLLNESERRQLFLVNEISQTSITVPAYTTEELGLEYNLLQDLGYTSQFSVVIEY